MVALLSPLSQTSYTNLIFFSPRVEDNPLQLKNPGNVDKNTFILAVEESDCAKKAKAADLLS